MRVLLFIASIFLILTGCTNPTRTYHPLDKPETSKGEIVKYENAEIKVKYRGDFAYEVKTPGSEDSVMFFANHRFCYDPQNRNIVVPLKDSIGYDITTPKDGLFVAIPRDSVTLCKNGIKNNSDFARNHALHGTVYGVIVGGAIFGLGAMAILPFFLLASQGSFNTGLFLLYSVGIGSGAGAITGLTFDTAINGEKIIEDVEERCSAYYTEEELEKFLNDNRCY